MAVSKVVAVKAPVVLSNGRAKLLLISGIDGSPTLADGPIQWTVNDAGAVINLSIGSVNDPIGPWIEAAPVAVGTAVVTGTLHEAAAIMTATLTCTVALVGSHLNATWSSGTLTVH